MENVSLIRGTALLLQAQSTTIYYKHKHTLKHTTER